MSCFPYGSAESLFCQAHNLAILEHIQSCACPELLFQCAAGLDFYIRGIVSWNEVFQSFFGTDIRLGKVVFSTANSPWIFGMRFHEALKIIVQTDSF
jgi:hypothetical protein